MPSVSNYRKQGGSEWIVGGELNVESGGALDVESGGSFKIDGTEVTATAAELNKVDGDRVVKSKVVEIAYDTTDLDTGVDVMTLAADEVLLSLDCRITTAWNSNTSDDIYIGHGGSLDEFVDSQDAQSTGLVTIVSGAIPPAISGSDTDIQVKVVEDGSGGSTADQGAAEIIVTYTT